ncbi:MAG: hypothetical protein WBJ84_09175 [Bacteroidales bacterium]
MKTLRFYNSCKTKLFIVTTFLTTFMLCVTIESRAYEFNFPVLQAETEIDDIPFDTHEIAVNYWFEQAMEDIIIPAENYVEDISFDTHEIVVNKIFENLISNIRLPVEDYVDDVPFNTLEIVVNYWFEKATSNIVLPAEGSVNDVPFETSVVVAKFNEMKASQAENARNSFFPHKVVNPNNKPAKIKLVPIIILSVIGVLSFILIGSKHHIINMNEGK